MVSQVSVFMAKGSAINLGFYTKCLGSTQLSTTII